MSANPTSRWGLRALGLGYLTMLLLIPLLKFVQAFPIWGLYIGYQFLGLTEVLPFVYVPISLGILIYLAVGFRRAAREAEVNWKSAG